MTRRDYLEPDGGARAVRPAPDQALVLVAERTGPRHVLAGRHVHAGAALELSCADGSWMRGIYQWTFDPGDDAVLVVDGMWGPVSVPLQTSSALRWPKGVQ